MGNPQKDIFPEVCTAVIWPWKKDPQDPCVSVLLSGPDTSAL